MIAAAYLAAEGCETALAEELARRSVTISAWHGRLALSPDPPVPAAWALDTWTAPREIQVASIAAAADALRALQRNWSAYGVAYHRRMALITERLPKVKAAPLVFPAAAPSSHLGAWTLLAPDRMLASPRKTSPFVNGEVRFVEDRLGPPNRAYLKLWEALVRLGCWPGPGDRSLDLGASPGGWTWVLAQLGADVVAVDKAPLDPQIAALPNVATRQESAFGLEPEPVDWLCSDVIAYPDRLLALVLRWLPVARHIVCTIKLQGEINHEAVEEFTAIPGATVTHLFHNKHELTFLYMRDRTDKLNTET